MSSNKKPAIITANLIVEGRRESRSREQNEKGGDGRQKCQGGDFAQVGKFGKLRKTNGKA